VQQRHEKILAAGPAVEFFIRFGGDEGDRAAELSSTGRTRRPPARGSYAQMCGDHAPALGVFVINQPEVDVGISAAEASAEL